jgi:UPF0755 protein
MLGLAAITILMIGIFVFKSIPEIVESKFGPPGDSLSNTQKIIYAIRLFQSAEKLEKPNNLSTELRVFTIKPGETGSEVASSLKEKGFISDASAFQTLMLYSNVDRKLQAGIYSVSASMPPKQILSYLYDSDPSDVNFVILPGWRMEEIADVLEFSGLSLDKEQFINAVINPPQEILEILPYKSGTLEGLLFPGNYQIQRDVTLNEFLKIPVNRFLVSLPADYQKKLENTMLSLEETIVIASIIQKEAVNPSEGARIAGVFLNRIRSGMPLQSDPTVQYAIGFITEQGTWWKNPLTKSDMIIQSQFNTYIEQGIPPSPICNPGLSALENALNPESHDFLFFRMACDGSGNHVFSRTFEEHLQAACQ